MSVKRDMTVGGENLFQQENYFIYFNESTRACHAKVLYSKTFKNCNFYYKTLGDNTLSITIWPVMFGKHVIWCEKEWTMQKIHNYFRTFD